MSLFGKILALLNVLGAIGLVCVASMDYGKRQSWAYSLYRHKLLIDGLPLDEHELDADSHPRVDRANEETLRQVFGSVGGNPVATQRQEVERVKRLLDEKLQAASQTKSQQAYVYARILLPLAETYKDREQMLACRAHFASDAQVNELKRRCQEAFQTALKPDPNPPDEQRKFHEVFRLTFRTQPGDPAEQFVNELLKPIPDDRDKAKASNIDAAFDAAVEAQRKALEERYTTLFAEAMGSLAQEEGGRSAMDAQKAAIARLLHGLCVFLSEDPTKPQGTADRAADQQALVGTSTYRQNLNRVLVVCGVRAGLNAMARRADELHRLSDYVLASIMQERSQFVADHGALIGQIREQAALVQIEQRLINENKEKLSAATTVVNLRKNEIEQVEQELKVAENETTQAIQRLREKSDEVLKLRQKIRDAIADNEKGELRIRELEKLIQKLDDRER